MKKKDLISKWLDHELTADELKAFEASNAFGSLSRIDQAAELVQKPELDVALSYQKLKAKRDQVREKSLWNWRRAVVSVAAVAVIALGLFWVVSNNSGMVQVMTAMGEKTELTLPDSSEVVLNAGSSLEYDQNWDDVRAVRLNGEALFEVEEGKTFTVETSVGTIQVLGTRFNVKNRDNWFEVTCFDGLVEVKFGASNYKLSAGNSFRLVNGQPHWEETSMTNPAWVANKSIFKSVPLSSVLSELERQYAIEIEATEIDKSVIFTGSFTHEDLETALRAISIPLSLTFEVKENSVTLK
ncbi:FecR family protein [Aureitalea marina]|uniref:FecR protein domain-containing protein n=1 Tax=Aureitalea marina TaxID=930804 RepID=A0A2S7KQJ6_9FLAO|nr:FecR domain-containing protein [Aureitalea marina]PQB04904.1 hypothetical protein BST85_08385 [Aureitalea marina]